MNFPDGLFPPLWHALAWLPVLMTIVWAASGLDLRRFAGSPQHNIWLGSVVILVLLWSMNAGVRPGLGLHLLGASALVLMFGVRLAILALALVIAASAANGSGGWTAYPLNLLVSGIVPALAGHSLVRICERHLPNNFFVFVFANAFFGAAATVAASGFAAVALLAAAEVYPWEFLSGEYLPYFLLLGFAEAWITGAVVTLMVVYLPRWVSAFDDARYLLNK